MEEVTLQIAMDGIIMASTTPRALQIKYVTYLSYAFATLLNLSILCYVLDKNYYSPLVFAIVSAIAAIILARRLIIIRPWQ